MYALAIPLILKILFENKYSLISFKTLSQSLKLIPSIHYPVLNLKLSLYWFLTLVQFIQPQTFALLVSKPFFNKLNWISKSEKVFILRNKIKPVCFGSLQFD